MLSNERRLVSAAIFFLMALVVVHFLTLTHVPEVHEDEPWLGERTMAWLAGSENRAPSFPLSFAAFSGITPLYVAIQSLSVKPLGFTLEALRLPALLAFLLSLPLWYLFFARCFSRPLALIFVLFYSLEVITWKAAHSGRAESLNLFFMALGLALGGLRFSRPWPIFLLMGVVSSLPMLIAPAGLLVPLVVGPTHLIASKEENEPWARFVVPYVVGVCAVLVLYFSLVSFSDFVRVFFGPVSRLNVVGGTVLGRLSAFSAMALTLSWESIVKYRIVLFFVHTTIFIAGVTMLYRSDKARFKKVSVPLMGLAAAFVCLSVFGRPALPYLAYLSPWLTICFVFGVWHLFPTFAGRWKTVGVALCLQITYLCAWAATHVGPSSEIYEAQLKAIIPQGARILGSISNKLLFHSDYVFFAVEDLDYGKRLEGRLDLPAYFNAYAIEYALVDCSNLPGKVPKSARGDLCEELKGRARVVAQVDSPFTHRNFISLTSREPAERVDVYKLEPATYSGSTVGLRD